MSPRVAVVGAGYAGLAAAVALTRAGCAVTVYEANRVPGGRARRVEYRGAPRDNGQHLLRGADRATLDDARGGRSGKRAPRAPSPHAANFAAASRFARPACPRRCTSRSPSLRARWG